MKLEINNRKVSGYCQYLKLKNIQVNNPQTKEETKREILKYLETNDNGITAYQNVWGAETEVLKDKLIEMNA